MKAAICCALVMACALSATAASRGQPSECLERLNKLVAGPSAPSEATAAQLRCVLGMQPAGGQAAATSSGQTRHGVELPTGRLRDLSPSGARPSQEEIDRRMAETYRPAGPAIGAAELSQAERHRLRTLLAAVHPGPDGLVIADAIRRELVEIVQRLGSPRP